MSDASAAKSIPLSVPVLAGRESEYVNEALESGWVSTGGPFISRFENAVREATGARNAVACVNGTAALQVALRLAGVLPGDEVIVPTLTFIATVNAAAYLGAHPVFVDCDEFMNIDPAAVESFLGEECTADGQALIDRATGRRIAAVVPVHVFGNPCELAPLLATAERYGLPVIEDAAESLGSYWTAGPLTGRHTGTPGRIGTLSFNANKIVTTGGGGMILTEDDDLAEHARYLTTTAKNDAVRFVHNELGYNFRLTNLSAAVGVAQMETLRSRIDTKRRNHALYAEALAGIRGVTLLGVPEGTKPNYWFYSLIIDPQEYGRDRESLMAALDAEGIQTRPVWHLNHWQQYFRDERAYRIERAEWFWRRVLNLPCTSNLTEDEIDRVADAIRRNGGA